MNLLERAILMLKEPSNHILIDACQSFEQPPNSLTCRQGENGPTIFWPSCYTTVIMLPTLADGLRVFIKLTTRNLSSLPLPLAIHLAWDVFALCSYVLIALLHASLCLNNASSQKSSLPSIYYSIICIFYFYSTNN